MTNNQLWEKLKHFEVGDPNSEFNFIDRLARENDWSMEFSIRVFEEYKKFIFLICIAEHPLTPSDQVDQAWHLHLLYTESYWQEMCKDTLGKNINHGPTKGGQSEKDKYNDWYAKTKEVYRNVFETDPPEDIWPPSHIRFGQLNFTRVNRHTNWVIKKPKLFTKWKR
ncbi:glycine-rich domain-containing protein [Ekhidna sp.]